MNEFNIFIIFLVIFFIIWIISMIGCTKKKDEKKISVLFDFKDTSNRYDTTIQGPQFYYPGMGNMYT